MFIEINRSSKGL